MLGKLCSAATGVIAIGTLMSATAGSAAAAEPITTQGGSGSFTAKVADLGSGF
ncbi:hypothetical protein ACWIGX_19210 [Streptomyces nigrescens]